MGVQRVDCGVGLGVARHEENCRAAAIAQIGREDVTTLDLAKRRRNVDDIRGDRSRRQIADEDLDIGARTGCNVNRRAEACLFEAIMEHHVLWLLVMEEATIGTRASVEGVVVAALHVDQVVSRRRGNRAARWACLLHYIHVGRLLLQHVTKGERQTGTTVGAQSDRV
eukprot:5878267-Prymnesium_polylepis.1